MNTRLAATRDLIRLNMDLAYAIMLTTASRRRHGPRRSRWPWWFESIQQMMARSTPGVGDIVADEIRAPLDRATRLPLWPRVHIQSVEVNGLPAEWITARSPNDRVILFLHGGGYVSGSPRTHRTLTAELANVTQGRVLAPAYRLAPEAAYPAALEDAWGVYWWLLDQGVPPSRIVVMGDSAGGGLTIALLVALRDAGLPLPAGAVGLSPWVDLAMTGATLQTNASTDYINENVLRASARMYLDGRSPQETPLASPLYADLRGLPPLLIQAGSAEMLLDDALRLAAAAKAADVDTTLEVWDDMIHVWHFFYRIAPDARQAIDHIADFVARQAPVAPAQLRWPKPRPKKQAGKWPKRRR
ncbi:MAG: alpha/beta hydrolase [Caldilineaceae bacterium]|nr:alpha/beta hydrolase [Caldilineaceae bacterium]